MKLITRPIRPEASTKEKPKKENLNNSSRCEGFLLMELTRLPKIRPTPIATPVKALLAIAPATNLKAITIIIMKNEVVEEVMPHKNNAVVIIIRISCFAMFTIFYHLLHSNY